MVWSNSQLPKILWLIVTLRCQKGFIWALVIHFFNNMFHLYNPIFEIKNPANRGLYIQLVQSTNLLELSHQKDQSQELNKREVNITYLTSLKWSLVIGTQEKPLPQVFEEQREYHILVVLKKHTTVLWGLSQKGVDPNMIVDTKISPISTKFQTKIGSFTLYGGTSDGTHSGCTTY